jgi:predicted DNA-binding transcriptional regulator AlpA
MKIGSNTKSKTGWPLSTQLAAQTGVNLKSNLKSTTFELSPGGEVRLLSRPEVMRIVGVTYPTLWAWMRAGTFPRSVVIGGKSAWIASEIEDWLANLPRSRLKGDPDGPTPASKQAPRRHERLCAAAKVEA